MTSRPSTLFTLLRVLSKLRLAMPLRSIPFRLRVTALRQPRHVKILAPSSETEAAIENPRRPT